MPLSRSAAACLSRAKRLAGQESGAIAVATALLLPMVFFVLALGIDFGYLTLQKRDLQSTADLSAIAVASRVSDAENQLLAHFAMNGLNFGVRTANGLKTAAGTRPFAPETVFETVDGYATIVLGRYDADPAIATGNRFRANALPPDAARVSLVRKSDMFFGHNLVTPPVLAAEGTATARKLAAFSVGSRLASLDGGILNAILGALLGSKLSLKAMDYEALAAVNIDLLSFMRGLATSLDLKALTYEDILKTEIKLPALIDQLGGTQGLSPSVNAIVNNLAKTLNKVQLTVRLEEILALGPLSQRPIGFGDNLSVEASLLDIVSAAAFAANGGKQVGVDLGAALPGLASVALQIAIGEPPVETPPMRVGETGSVVRTAQTRISLDIGVNGVTALLGIRLNVPLYVEVANAEAKLTDIACYGGGPADAAVKVAAVPGVTEIALGNVDQSAFINFGSKPRVKKATIVDATLVEVNALAHVTAGNLSATTLSFSPQDIAANKLRSVSTKDTLTSLTQSLLKNLNLEVNLRILTITTPQALTSAIADTLALVTKPVDTLLYNLLLLLGVRIGETDVRVTGVSCEQPVLVQ